MTAAADLRDLASHVEGIESKLERVTWNAHVLCRTLGYAHGEGGAAFVGPPIVAGFVDTETAIRQLIESLAAKAEA